MGTAIVGIGLIVMIGLIIKQMIHSKKSGKSSHCGGNCKNCGGNCH